MPLLKIRNTSLTPPGYWRFPRWPDRPLTGKDSDFIVGGDIGDLVKNIIEFRVINNLPLGDPEAECQDFLCRQSPGPICAPANPARMMPGVKAKGAMVARFLYAMAQWMMHGGHVDQDEAERRGELCANCEHNQSVQDEACLGCFGVTAKIIGIIGDRKTRVDGCLKFCNVCGCSNAVSAFVPMDILARVHNLKDFPDDIGIKDSEGKPVPCWKRAYAESQKI